VNKHGARACEQANTASVVAQPSSVKPATKASPHFSRTADQFVQAFQDAIAG